MKKSFFYFAALSLWCMASLSSCMKEAVMTDSTETTQATIKLTLTGSAGTRASGTSEPASDNTGEGKITSLVVGFFDKDGNKIDIQKKTDYSSTPSTETFTLSLPTTGISNCTAVAVANAPAATVTALSGCATKAVFLACTVGLSDAQSSLGLPMSGDVKTIADASSFTLVNGTFLKVELVRMVARIGLIGIKTNFSAPYTGATVKLQRIFLRNAIENTKVTPSTIVSEEMSGTSYLIGGGTWTPGTPGSWNDGNSYLFNSLAGNEVPISSSSALPDSKYHYFYAFANDASQSGAKETAFVIQALFDADGAGTTYNEETVFYPVIIGKSGNGYTTSRTTGLVSRNMIYKIGVTIKSKGASSPYDNIEDGVITLTVSVKSWADAPQNVEF